MNCSHCGKIHTRLSQEVSRNMLINIILYYFIRHVMKCSEKPLRIHSLSCIIELSWRLLRGFLDGYSPVSHRDGPSWLPAQVMRDLWWTKWHWNRFPPRTSVAVPILTPRLLHTHLLFGAGTIGQLVTDVRSGLSRPTPKKLIN
jgi:hypothetical protein